MGMLDDTGLTFVRVLYGDGTGWPLPKDQSNGERLRAKLVKTLADDIADSFQNDPGNFFCDKVQYVTMGDWATVKLKSYGIKHLTKVSNESSCRPRRFNHFWNKLYLLQKAVELFGDIIYTDFDCVPTADFEDKFEEALETMDGKKVQLPLIEYQSNSSYKWRPFLSQSKGKGWDAFNSRIGLCGCFILIRDPQFVNKIMEDWGSFRGIRYSDEQSITHYMEKHHRIKTVRESYEALEPESVRVVRSPLTGLGVVKNKAIFEHR